MCILVYDIAHICYATHPFGSNLPQCTFIWGADNAHYVKKLILVVAPTEEGNAGNHLGEDASTRPDVDRRVVCPRTHQNIWRSVP